MSFLIFFSTIFGIRSGGGFELKERWKSGGYELKKMVYFQNQLHTEFIFKFSYIKKGSLFSKSEFIFKINCINKGSKERKKILEKITKKIRRKCWKKRRIRNRKKHWSLFILAPSNPTNEYQVASRVSLTRKCDLFL